MPAPRDRGSGGAGGLLVEVGLERERGGSHARLVGDRREERRRAAAQVAPDADALAVRDPGGELRPEGREVDARRVARVAARLPGRALHELREAARRAALEVVEPRGELDEALEPLAARAVGL